jgi:hypothetical protein
MVRPYLYKSFILPLNIYGLRDISIDISNINKGWNFMAKKLAFGGYTICFAGRKESMEEVFGKGKITPSDMTKKLWAFVKSKRLAGK